MTAKFQPVHLANGQGEFHAESRSSRPGQLQARREQLDADMPMADVMAQVVANVKHRVLTRQAVQYEEQKGLKS